MRENHFIWEKETRYPETLSFMFFFFFYERARHQNDKKKFLGTKTLKRVISNLYGEDEHYQKTPILNVFFFTLLSIKIPNCMQSTLYG